MILWNNFTLSDNYKYIELQVDMRMKVKSENIEKEQESLMVGS